LFPGDRIELTATAMPQNATNRNLAVRVSDPSVISFANGVVRGISPGISTITFEAQDGSGVINSVVITVSERPVQWISLSRMLTTLHPGEAFELTATAMPQNAANRALTYTVDDPDGAISFENGSVTAIAPGVATITFEAMDGSGIQATATVNVREPVLVHSIRLPRNDVTIYVGDAVTVSPVVLPTNAANRNLSVTISDPEVISFEGGVLRGLAPGVSTVTFEAQDGSGVQATGTVTVQQRGFWTELVQALTESVDDPGCNASSNFTRQVNLRNVANDRIPQGFAVGRVNAFSFERGRNTADIPDPFLYRYNIASGDLRRMSVMRNQTVGQLGHANDMALTEIGGNTYMFVVAWCDDGGDLTPAIVRLRIVENTYYEVRRYPTTGGAMFGGITSLGHVAVGDSTTPNAVRFLLRGSVNYFTVDIPYNLPDGTRLPHTPRFAINEGDYGGWTRQGIYFSNGQLYVPLWNRGTPRQSAILRYTVTSNNLTNNHAINPVTLSNINRIWRFDGGDRRTFEIEGVGIRNGEIWFNTFAAGRSGGIYIATERP